MDLTTHYLGLTLPHPIMPGASPMVDDLDVVKRLEDAGAAAIVMHSLFEEQIVREQVSSFRHMDGVGNSFAEALSFFPEPEHFALGPDAYLEQIRRIKRAVDVPVIASLNGTSLGGWLDYAKLMQDAGADALELNVYAVSADPEASGFSVEETTLEMIRAVKDGVRIPLAVKLSPFYSSLANFARRADHAGADALVLFNRFYQPDIDVETLDVKRSLRRSDPSELPMRLRWLAILDGQIRSSLAVSGGVHSGLDAIKAVMAGADAVQMVSALLEKGPTHLTAVLREMEEWMEAHGYDTLAEMHGSMNLASCPDPAAYERANYMLILQGHSWRKD